MPVSKPVGVSQVPCAVCRGPWAVGRVPWAVGRGLAGGCPPRARMR